MDPWTAFAVTKRTLADNLGAEIVDEQFEEESFGDFVVSFRFGGRNGSIVTDRFQMFICDDLRGAGDGKLLFQRMSQVGEQELASVLVSVFSSCRWHGGHE